MRQHRDVARSEEVTGVLRTQFWVGGNEVVVLVFSGACTLMCLCLQVRRGIGDEERNSGDCRVQICGSSQGSLQQRQHQQGTRHV